MSRMKVIRIEMSLRSLIYDIKHPTKRLHLIRSSRATRRGRAMSDAPFATCTASSFGK